MNEYGSQSFVITFSEEFKNSSYLTLVPYNPTTEGLQRQKTPLWPLFVLLFS
jgi:hypothetical protein